MPTDCDIRFDHLNGVYNSGESLNGIVELRTNTSKSIRGISVKINGYAKVRWSESRTRQRNGKTEHYRVVYSAHDQYLNSVSYVLGSDGGNSFDLTPGTYNYTFTCYLPPTLPTSCEGGHGEIRYEVIVTIDRPFMFDNVFKQGFTIIQPLNLNLDPSLKIPRKVEGSESGCCFFCCCTGGGNISAELNIPFGGYTPGQKIQFKLFVFNDSNSDIHEAKIKLYKTITFESRTPSHKQRHTGNDIATKHFGPILRLTRKEFKDFIQIPSIPPSSTNLAQCIRFDYKLMGTVKTGCCSSNIYLSIPITIGTVPLIESATNPANVISIQPTAPLIDQNNSGGDGQDLPPSYLSVAPPSYEDSLSITDKFDDDERDDKHKEMPFKPKYPVYHNFAGLPTAPPNSDMPTIQIDSSRSDYGWSSQ